MKEMNQHLTEDINDYKKCLIKRIEIPSISNLDERDPRSPAIREDPPEYHPIRTVAEILKDLRRASYESEQNVSVNNLGIRI